jgi:8-oxo-dGTP diphosphatase
MSTNIDLFKVSCKVALYNSECSHVLLVEHRKNCFGLPGGHMEENEDPETAARRELYEELGIDYQDELSGKSFWRHPEDGRVILAFAGVIDRDVDIIIDPSEIRDARWVGIDEIVNRSISAGYYDEFIIQNAQVINK